MNVRAIVAWTLYDFANSSFAAVVFATIYATYYAMAVVGNETGLDDLWWGRVISVSTATPTFPISPRPPTRVACRPAIVTATVPFLPLRRPPVGGTLLAPSTSASNAGRT